MENVNNEQTTPDTPEHDSKLSAEAARRRIQAKEAAQRADAAEAEAASLRAQIAELRLAQARQAVTAAHPELTAALIEQYAPEGVDADSLSDWAEKALGLVVALRGEKEPDTEGLSDAERELAERDLTIARMKAQKEHPQITDEMFDSMCKETTPEGVAEWANTLAKFIDVKKEPAAQEPRSENEPQSTAADYPQTKKTLDAIKMSKVSPGKWVGADEGTGLEKVAKRLKR